MCKITRRQLPSHCSISLECCTAALSPVSVCPCKRAYVCVCLSLYGQTSIKSGSSKGILRQELHIFTLHLVCMCLLFMFFYFSSPYSLIDFSFSHVLSTSSYLSCQAFPPLHFFLAAVSICLPASATFYIPILLIPTLCC